MAHGPSGVGFDGHDGFGTDGHGGIAHAMSSFDFGFHGHGGEVTRDAVIVAHSFGNGHIGMTGADHSVDIHSGAHFGEHGDMDAIGASFSGAVDTSKQAFGIAVVGHGYVDVNEAVRKSLAGLGLLELFTPQGDRKRITRETEEIKPMRPAFQGAAAVMSDGYYEGATGITTETRSFWQFGQRSVMDKITGKPGSLDPKARWNIDVSITRWFYAESGDYETRILASVWSGFICKTEDADDRIAHLKAAREFIKQMLETLKKATPNERSRTFREQHAGSSDVVVEEIAETVTETAEVA